MSRYERIIFRQSSGKCWAGLQYALTEQRAGRSICVITHDLEELDFLVAHGIKPSNIKLSSELQCPSCDWQTAHVGIFEETNG